VLPAPFAQIAGRRGLRRETVLFALREPLADLPGNELAMGMAGEPGQLFGPVRQGFGGHESFLVPRQRAGGAGGQRDFPRAAQELFVGHWCFWQS
jgi:hypothetical protein